MVKNLYSVWLKIDETLPWIELKRTYETRKEAKEAAKNYLNRAQIKVIGMPQKGKQLKAIATIRR
jgi:hypothetical protein